MKKVRIGAGQGFYGDSLLPVLDTAARGEVDYIAFDALAELTLAILEKGRRRDPSQGYTQDVVPMMRNLLPLTAPKGIKLITNAGGINPKGAAEAVKGLCRQLGLHHLKVAHVTGDDIYDRLDELAAAGVTFDNKETGQPLSAVRDRLLFASVYLGAWPIVEALRRGADVVITGRTTDTAQFLAPMIHELGWSPDDHDRIGQGLVLGHIMECSGQVSGGNFAGDWWNVPELWRIGFPICEVYEDGSAVITKAPDTGGLVNLETVKEQFLYEIHDPRRYLTPDATVDFTTARLEDDGPNRVRVSGATGSAPPPTLKALLGYADGFMGEGFVSFSWPDALAKARLAERILRERMAMQGIEPEEVLVEWIGVNSLHGPLAPVPDDVNEVRLRVAIRTRSRDDAVRFSREFAPLLLSGPPTASAVQGVSSPRELMGLWSTLIPRELIEPHVRVVVEEVGRS